ncbi:MAG: septum formation protein Maf [Oscillospiraceae bacterium]|nr:septum formation protein Maf [Oscillospiraceae bacterium]
MSLILASGSPRRKELLSLITDDFIVHSVDADETLPAGMPVEMAAAYLADLKAHTAAQIFPDQIVIGCDTIVLLGDEIMGKPKDREDAHRMLRALSGETHSVLTGTSLYYGTQTTVFTTETLVTFYPLSDAEIERYLDTGEPFDKAGAYGIQGKGSLLVQGIEGDYFNVVGLPVAGLSRALRQFEELVKKPKIHLNRPSVKF